MHTYRARHAHNQPEGEGSALSQTTNAVGQFNHLLVELIKLRVGLWVITRMIVVPGWSDWTWLYHLWQRLW